MSLSTVSRIWVTFKKHGIHRYPGAPEVVSYLANEHRHLFGFKITIAVTHDDREVEFHMLQSELMALYSDGVLSLDHKSCEMIARELLATLTSRYPDRPYYAVEVDEDGECGAILISEPNV